MKKNYYIFIILFVISCSTRNNGFVNKQFHALTSWNNILFNGQQEYDKLQKSKKESYKDDYFKILPVELFNPFEISDEDTSYDNTARDFKVVGNNSLQLGGENSTKTGYAKSIEKSLKAIDKHSMLIKGKEYNRMMSRAYLLLGKSYLYQGKNVEAINALSYIKNNIPKSKLINQSNIYIAEAQSASGNTYDAEEFYTALKNNKLKKKDWALFSKKYSQFLINTKKNENAIEQLNTAYKYNKNKLERGRFRYIQGQLYEQLGDKRKALEYYNLAYKTKPSWEMEVKSQIAMAQLFDANLDDFKEKEIMLLHLTKKGQYQSKKNELYYALAMLAIQADSLSLAENYYKKSIKEKESDTEIRALAYKNLGDIYFKNSKYLLAGNYYDSAFIKIQNKDLKDKISTIKTNIDALAKRYYLIKKNDSILHIFAMNEGERKDFFNDYIKKLKDSEVKKQKEIEENNSYFITETKSITDFSNSFDNKGKFYFYNTSAKFSGQQDFKKNWGERALTDNWRIKQNNLASINTEEKLLDQEDQNNPERFNIDYYLDKIPKNSSEVEILKIERDTAELFLGIAYQKDFKDTKFAVKTLEHLLTTPPKDEDIKLQALYNLYNFNKEKNTTEAEKYKNALVSQYPNSKYAEFILNPTINYFTDNSKEAIEFYKKTYEKYENGEFNEVKQMAEKALELFPKDVIIAKFSLLAAYSEGKLGNKEAFLNGLKRVSVVFEDTDEATKANELIKQFDIKIK